MIYSPAMRRAHMDRELDKHLEEVYGNDEVNEDEDYEPPYKEPYNGYEKENEYEYEMGRRGVDD